MYELKTHLSQSKSSNKKIKYLDIHVHSHNIRDQDWLQFSVPDW